MEIVAVTLADGEQVKLAVGQTIEPDATFIRLSPSLIMVIEPSLFEPPPLQFWQKSGEVFYRLGSVAFEQLSPVGASLVVAYFQRTSGLFTGRARGIVNERNDARMRDKKRGAETPFLPLNFIAASITPPKAAEPKTDKEVLADDSDAVLPGF